MKQIFDWMRKKPLKAFEVYDGSIGVYPCEINRLIDEAEAKWEAECCEYEYHVAPSKDIYFLTRCNHRHNGRLSGDRPYCGFCGKPIKISEVE